jgi:hypothetical protein
MLRVFVVVMVVNLGPEVGAFPALLFSACGDPT